MKKIIIAAALLACACSPPAATTTSATTASTTPTNAEPSLTPVTLPVSDRAGNRMEALTQHGARWCSGDNTWCAQAAEDQPVSITHGAQTIALPGRGEVWPNIIRTGNDVIVGVVMTDQQMYSGGGGTAEHLKLYNISGAAAREVATLPLSGALDLRACFNEDDQHTRLDACSDQYTFVSRISLDETVSSGAPRIVLETMAGTYPGHVSRSEDSSQAGQLHEADLVWWHDDTCSYRRIFNRGANGLYAPDQPLPACSDYLEP